MEDESISYLEGMTRSFLFERFEEPEDWYIAFSDYINSETKLSIYKYNKEKATLGERVKCPSCKTKFTKTKNKVFCSNGRSGAGNCKDKYWNEIDPYKKNRSLVKPKEKKVLPPLYQGDYFTSVCNKCNTRVDFCRCLRTEI